MTNTFGVLQTNVQCYEPVCPSNWHHSTWRQHLCLHMDGKCLPEPHVVHVVLAAGGWAWKEGWLMKEMRSLEGTSKGTRIPTPPNSLSTSWPPWKEQINTNACSLLWCSAYPGLHLTKPSNHGVTLWTMSQNKTFFPFTLTVLGILSQPQKVKSHGQH